MLKLGCTSPNMANIFLPKSTDANFYPFTEQDTDIFEKFREDVVGSPSIVFTGKAVVDETFIRKSTNLFKSIVEIDPSHYTTNRCVNPWRLVLMCVGISIQRLVDSRSDKIRPIASKIWPCCIFNDQDQIVELNIPTIRADRRKLTVQCWFCFHANTVFEAMGCFYCFCPCQEVRPSVTEEDNKRGSRKGGLDEMRQSYVPEEGFTVTTCTTVSSWDSTRQQLMLNKMSEEIYRTEICWEITKSQGKRRKKIVWLLLMQHWSTPKFES